MINPNAEFAKIVFTDNRQFRVLFDEYLTLAFNAWGLMCPEIAEKLACKQYEILSVDIQKIMDEVCKKHGNAPISFLSALERKMLSATNWNDNGWVTSGATSTEKYILFLIGEIFIQIQWLWHLIPTQGNQASRTDALAICTRSCALGQLSTELAKRTSLTRSGKVGGEKLSTVRTRCEKIIRAHDCDVKDENSKIRLVETRKKLKDVYFELYGTPLQKRNKSGELTPCDNTINKWLDYPGSMPKTVSKK